MNAIERAVKFACEGDSLVGILHAPEKAAEIGVVVIVGGPQYRAGSHRQFVLLARAIAGAGHPVLRFDARGMGDSDGAPAGFEATTSDIEAAIDALFLQARGVRAVVLWGLCDAASAALLYWGENQDPRVCGLCLLNPWARSDAGLAKTHVKHYYARRLRQPAFWAKLLRGQVGWHAANGLIDNLRVLKDSSAHAAARSFQSRMAAAWKRFDKNILLALGGDDLTAKEFIEFTSSSPEWQGLLDRPQVQRAVVKGADHTFSDPESRKAIEMLVVDWIARLPGVPERNTRTAVRVDAP